MRRCTKCTHITVTSYSIYIHTVLYSTNCIPYTRLRHRYSIGEVFLKFETVGRVFLKLISIESVTNIA